MDRDKAIRAAKLTVKGMDKTSENIADYVAELLRQGRASEVTDDLMAQADPQRLHYHYTTGNTGMDMPMDQASRMERAAQMGFDENPKYHGGNNNLSAFEARRAGKGMQMNMAGVHFAEDPEFANLYAEGNGAQVYPAMTKGKTANGTSLVLEGTPEADIVKDLYKGSTKKPYWSSVDGTPNGIKATAPLQTHLDQFPPSKTERVMNKYGVGRTTYTAKMGSLSPYGGMNVSSKSPSELVSDPTNIRSQFARFDPRLSHLSHLSASTGGAMEIARAVVAKNRAGGQIAPSKYMPGVPRQVHADGGKVAFQQGNHPDVPDVLYHGNALQIAKKGWTDEIDPEQTQRNMESQDFRAFKPSSHGSYGAGIYLSDSPKVASDFAQGIRSDQKEAMPFGQVMKLHVSMKQPFTDDTLRHPEWKAYIKDAINQGLRLGGVNDEDKARAAELTKKLDDGTATVRDLFLTDTQHGPMVNQFGQQNIHKTIRNSGFDGIIAHRLDGTKEYVAFKPEQVKSAIGNSGKFDPTDPDMTKADGGAANAPMFQGVHESLQNESGAPLDLYHGTTQSKEFEAFDNAKLGARDAGFYGRGHYLTPLRDNAEGYADPDEMGRGAVIGPLHAALKNPYVWDVSSETKSHSTLRDLQSMGIMREKNELNPWDNLQSHHIQPFMAEMQKRGHDGVVVKTDHGHLPNGISEVVAFDPKTIKHTEAEAFDPTDPRIRREDGGEVDGGFEVGKKYNGVIPQIKYLPVHAIERQPSEHEVSRVSDDVAKNMDFSEPVEATAFRYSSNHSEDHPSVALQNGHHRLAAARQTGRPHLPVTLTAVNAKGEKLNALKALSDEIERSMVTKADGGRIGYADGGKSLGLYSKAAQIIRSQPQAKGNVDQLLAMVSKGKGVKPTELASAGRPAGDTMSKEELAQHFEQALPDVRVTEYKKELLSEKERQEFEELAARYGKSALSDYETNRFMNLNDMLYGNTKYDEYTLPNGKNYREHLLHLPTQDGPFAKRKKELQDQWQQAYENQAPKEELDRLGAEFDAINDDAYAENVNFKSNHWQIPNVLAHVRMDDRDNGKTLHVQEVQSDWGQEGRDKGFHDPENPYEVVRRKTKEVVSRHPDYSSAWDAYRTHPESNDLDWGDSGDEKPPQGPYVGNTQQWTDLALKHVLTEAAKGGHDRVVFSPGEANADLYGQRKEVGTLKFLKSKDSGEAGIVSAYSKDGRRSSEHEVGSHDELSKLLGKENAANLLAQSPTEEPDSGEGVYAHRLQGPLQVGGHGMVDYYKNYVHAGALKLLQQHDPSIKPENYDLPEGYKGFSLPMTDTARQSILKNGFQAFQRGGEVHKATGGPVMGYVPTAPIQIRQLAVAPIVPRQQQRPAGGFSQSLGSLMDTVNEFKNKPEEPTPSASSEGHTPTGMIPLPEQGYQPSGMYAPFQSAIDRMIAEAPGKISVASGYRTPERQAELWEAAAAKYPDPEVRDNWVARPGTSSHNYGLAADLSYADDEALKWAQENAARYGLNFRMDNEDWHIEPTNVFDIRSAMTIPGYATGGSVSKALALTRGFTKDGKSAIGSIKPKRK